MVVSLWKQNTKGMQSFKFDFLLKPTQAKRMVTVDVVGRFYITDNNGDPVFIGFGKNRTITDWASGLTLQQIKVLRDLLADNEIMAPGGKSKAMPKPVMDLPTALRNSRDAGLRNNRFADADEANDYLGSL